MGNPDQPRDALGRFVAADGRVSDMKTILFERLARDAGVNTPPIDPPAEPPAPPPSTTAVRPTRPPSNLPLGASQQSRPDDDWIRAQLGY